MRIKIILTCFFVLSLFIAFSGCGTKGLSSSTSGGAVLYNSNAGLKCTLTWPRSNQTITRNPYCIARVRSSNRTIPADADGYKIFIFQIPLDADDFQWAETSSKQISRSEYPGDSITVAFDGLYPSDTKIYIMAVSGFGGDDRVIAINFQNISLSSNQEYNADASLNDYYFVGTSESEVASGETETVTTPEATFANCMRIVSNLTSTNCPGTLQENYIEGQRVAYFKRNVGLIKAVYTHNDGSVTTIRLTGHKVTQNGDFWPLVVGNSWTYTWNNTVYCLREIVETVTVREANDFPDFVSDIPDWYQAGANPILYSSSDVNSEACFIFRIIGNCHAAGYNSQLGSDSYIFTPLSTWSLFGFWGWQEKIIPENPAKGDDFNSDGIEFGNTPLAGED